MGNVVDAEKFREWIESEIGSNGVAPPALSTRARLGRSIHRTLPSVPRHAPTDAGGCSGCIVPWDRHPEAVLAGFEVHRRPVAWPSPGSGLP